MLTVPVEKFYEVQMLLDKEKQKVTKYEIENKIQKETINGLLEIQYSLAKSGKKLEVCLQTIKELSETMLEKGLEPQSVEYQLRLKGKREFASIILEKILETGV